MKNIKYIFLFLLTSSIFLGCIKQIEKQFTGITVAEIDAAVLNSNASNLTYPIISRHPRGGLPINTTNSTTSCQIPQADSTVRRISRQVELRINIVGQQSNQERTVGYRVISSPITTFVFPATIASVTTSSTCSNPNVVFPAQLPAAPSSTLNVADAIAGIHFTTLSGKITIAANSSFGILRIPLIEGTATANSARYIGIQLDSSGSILPSINVRTIGIIIDQR